MATGDDNEQLTFSANNLPLLESGAYKISLGLSMVVPGNNVSPWIEASEFYVAGPRFSLAPQEISSFFPPDMASGVMNTVVPSITFTRPTLPWERSPNQSALSSNPWLALLLFNETEMSDEGGPVTLSNMTLKTLNPPGGLEPVDDPDSQVTVLTIPNSLAASVAPAFTDLQWLAHVRQSTNSADASLDGDTRAVLLCNRLPVAGARSYVFLVSLENQYTGGVLNAPSSGFLQLPVLSSWQFLCAITTTTFIGQLAALGVDPPTPRLPPLQGNPDPDPEPWLSQGYVALPHNLRSGESTVSWFHGPLGTGPRTIPFTFPSPGADALLIYDQTTGMFDAAYAAAWELGRLLTLQDQSMAMTLFKWKQEKALLDKQSEQVKQDAYLPVASELDQRNVLNDVQLAFLRLNQVGANNTFGSVAGSATLQSSGSISTMLNDTFGSSLTLPLEVATKLTAGNIGNLFASSFTISFWYRNDPSVVYGNNPVVVLLSVLVGSNGYLDVQIADGLLQLVVNGTSYNGEAGLIDTDWHQVMLSGQTVSGNTTYTLYFDGVSQMSAGAATVALSGFIMAGGTDLLQFYGNLANLRLFTAALGDADARLIMEADLRGQSLYPYFNGLALLKGVPFNYLINNEAMLPQESIRFFCFDMAWVNSLLDGAFSIGRISAAQFRRDEKSWNELGLNPLQTVSGFLIRSQVISAWEDMSVSGYSDVISGAGTPSTLLEILRMELLSQNVLLCLFNGQVQTVDIYTRDASIHSGVDSVTGTTVTKTVRDANGDITQNQAQANLSSLNVIDIGALADSMNSFSLFNVFYSAQFGMEMLAAAPGVRFIYNPQL